MITTRTDDIIYPGGYKNMIRHPAKYSDNLMPVFDSILPKDGEILDCFAGTGKLKTIRSNATLLEIEPEWAKINGAIVGDATQMPFEDVTFSFFTLSLLIMLSNLAPTLLYTFLANFFK